MATFVILSRIAPEAVNDPKDFKALSKTVADKIKQQCPGVTWKDSFATLGRFDVVDIVEATKPEEVEKAAMIIRSLRARIYRDFGGNSLEGVSLFAVVARLYVAT